MALSNLPNEITVQILQSCSSISDVLALAATCRHLRTVLNSPSNRLTTLYEVAEAQFGPLEEAIRVLTFNDSQPAHVVRPTPPRSLPLLEQILELGHVANAWADMYPMKKWRKEESVLRRLLTPMERRHLRRACYRIALYSLAYHTQDYPTTTRRSPAIIRERAALIRPWSTRELAEMMDLQAVLRRTIQSSIAPSNQKVAKIQQRKHRDCFAFQQAKNPRSKVLMQYGHYLAPLSQIPKFVRAQEDIYGTSQGWGDEDVHCYVLDDMLKLTPSQLMDLFSTVVTTAGSYQLGKYTKEWVEAFVYQVDGGDGWFEHNGQTLGETIQGVIEDRGDEIADVQKGIDDGWFGIAQCSVHG